MSAAFLADGVPLPQPTGVSVQWQVVAQSARALDGTLHVDYRARRRVVELRWGLLSPSDVAAIEALDPASTVTPSWDEPEGTVTITAVPRPGGRALTVGRSIWDASAGGWWWTDVTLTLEEV